MLTQDAQILTLPLAITSMYLSVMRLPMSEFGKVSLKVLSTHLKIGETLLFGSYRLVVETYFARGLLLIMDMPLMAL